MPPRPHPGQPVERKDTGQADRHKRHARVHGVELNGGGAPHSLSTTL